MTLEIREYNNGKFQLWDTDSNMLIVPKSKKWVKAIFYEREFTFFDTKAEAEAVALEVQTPLTVINTYSVL